MGAETGAAGGCTGCGGNVPCVPSRASGTATGTGAAVPDGRSGVTGTDRSEATCGRSGALLGCSGCGPRSAARGGVTSGGGEVRKPATCRALDGTGRVSPVLSTTRNGAAGPTSRPGSTAVSRCRVAGLTPSSGVDGRVGGPAWNLSSDRWSGSGLTAGSGSPGVPVRIPSVSWMGRNGAGFPVSRPGSAAVLLALLGSNGVAVPSTGERGPTDPSPASASRVTGTRPAAGSGRAAGSGVSGRPVARPGTRSVVRSLDSPVGAGFVAGAGGVSGTVRAGRSLSGSSSVSASAPRSRPVRPERLARARRRGAPGRSGAGTAAWTPAA